MAVLLALQYSQSVRPSKWSQFVSQSVSALTNQRYKHLVKFVNYEQNVTLSTPLITSPLVTTSSSLITTH